MMGGLPPLVNIPHAGLSAFRSVTQHPSSPAPAAQLKWVSSWAIRLQKMVVTMVYAHLGGGETACHCVRSSVWPARTACRIQALQLGHVLRAGWSGQWLSVGSSLVRSSLQNIVAAGHDHATSTAGLRSRNTACSAGRSSGAFTSTTCKRPSFFAPAGQGQPSSQSETNRHQHAQLASTVHPFCPRHSMVCCRASPAPPADAAGFGRRSLVRLGSAAPDQTRSAGVATTPPPRKTARYLPTSQRGEET